MTVFFCQVWSSFFVGLLLFNNPLSVNRQWTGMLSWPKRWNLPSCRSSKHRRTSVTLTRSSRASSQSSPSHKHPASSPPSSRKSLLTLTSPSWVDQWDFLWQEAAVQTYFYLPQNLRFNKSRETSVLPFSHSSTFPAAHHLCGLETHDSVLHHQPRFSRHTSLTLKSCWVWFHVIFSCVLSCQIYFELPTLASTVMSFW